MHRSTAAQIQRCFRFTDPSTKKEVIGPYLLERKDYVATQENGKGIGDKTRENRNMFIGFL
jgi:hypothetical protein